MNTDLKMVNIFINQFEAIEETFNDMPEVRLELLEAYIKYSIDGLEPVFSQSKAKAYWKGIAPIIDNSRKQREKKRRQREKLKQEQSPIHMALGEHTEAPKTSKGKTDNIRTFEDRMGSSIKLLEGKTYRDAIKLLTIQSKIADGSITKEEIRRYCDEQELVNQITIQDEDLPF